MTAEIYRGTTPTITCTVTDAEGHAVDLTGHTCFFSIGKPGKPLLTVSNSQMVIAGGTVAVTLTQEQTLALPKGTTTMQLRAVDDGVAIATEAEELNVMPVIYEEEIDDVVGT